MLHQYLRRVPQNHAVADPGWRLALEIKGRDSAASPPKSLFRNSLLETRLASKRSRLALMNQDLQQRTKN